MLSQIVGCFSVSTMKWCMLGNLLRRQMGEGIRRENITAVVQDTADGICENISILISEWMDNMLIYNKIYSLHI